MQALTRDDVTDFYKSHYGPADSALVLAGDITPAEARHVAEQYFGKWSGTASEAVTLPPAPEMQPTHVVIVDKPGAPQTMLMAFGLGVPANSPDLPTLQVMNYTLGGSLRQPHQHEPARRAWLHVRRELRLSRLSLRADSSSQADWCGQMSLRRQRRS